MCLVALPGLQFLVRLCTDMGLKEAQDYANKLKKAERQRELREQRQSSAGRRGSLIPGAQRMSGSREGSAGSGKFAAHKYSDR